ncbi:MAG: PEGA domain-containing protein [Kofleriaceae bacterium]
MKRVALILVLAAGTAHADDPKLAERLFRAGERAYKAQDYAGAATDFEQAYKALSLPEIAFSAAQAYRRQYRVDNKPSHVARAIELFRIYVAKVKIGGRVGDASDAIDDLQKELDRLIKSGVKVSPELAAEHTQLGVNVMFDNEREAHGMREVQDAPNQSSPVVDVTIDGAKVAPYAPTNVPPGKHALHVEAAGYAPDDRSIDVTQGDFRMVDVTLHAKPAHLVIETEARVVVDGRLAGDGPTSVELAAGKHLVALLHDGREPWAQELELGRGQELALAPALEVTAKRRWTTRTAIAGGVTGAVALAALTVALIEDSRASTLHDRFMSPGDQPPSAGADYNNALRWRGRATDALWVFGALTVAAGVTTAVLYYTDKPSIAVTGHF